VERRHSKTKSRNSPRKPAKTRGSYLPETKVLRIQERYVRGENKTAIAKAEAVDRGTVARIVQFPEVRQFIAQQQQEFYGLIPDAMAAVRHALQVTKDPKVGFQVLQATGVAPPPGAQLQIPGATEQDGMDYEAMLVASVLLESRDNFGTDLPKDMQDKLDAYKREHADDAKPARNLVRK
jgi:hypothetical protein